VVDKSLKTKIGITFLLNLKQCLCVYFVDGLIALQKFNETCGWIETDTATIAQCHLPRGRALKTERSSASPSLTEKNFIVHDVLPATRTLTVSAVPVTSPPEMAFLI
jgi:hypothetical protein